MRYRYKAFFTLADDNKSCFVSIPALGYDFTLKQNNMSRFALIRCAEKEAGITAYLYELESRTIPEDNPYYNEKCSFFAFLNINTEKAAKNTKIIKSFDFSDEHSL